MTVILVEHAASEPALHGAMAAVVAHHLGLDLHHTPTRHDLARHADAAQHVVATGDLVTSGLLWYERLTGRSLAPTVDVDRLAEFAGRGDVVVPLGPAVVDALADRLAEHGIATTRLRVVDEAGIFTLTEGPDDRPCTAFGAWTRDRFGRPVPVEERAPPSNGAPRIRIAFVGRESDQRDVYPATLAALGDAADGAGIDLDVTFLAPHGLDRATAAEVLATVDGVVLPGGSDMGVVAGQIASAEVALARALPTLGLCLGMQTLTTAAVRRAPGGAGASLAEADPAAPILTFVPIAPGATVHRLGDRRITIAPGSRLAALMGPHPEIRCNHRFRFDTRLEALASAGGIAVTARESVDDIVDGVEGTGATFFLGLQGHPELTSRAGAPHPVFSAFLAACLPGGVPSSITGSCP
jgi:CTP synthase